MNINRQVHLTTGQFAKLMDVKKDTLLYYDKKEEDEFIVVTDSKPLTNDKSIYDSIQRHYKYLEEYNILASASEGWMISVNNVLNGESVKYDYLYTKVNESKYANRKIEKGTYLVSYHDEGYPSIGQTYNRLVKHAKVNDLVLKSYFYEDILLDELSVKGFEKYLIKLFVHISD